MGLKSLLNVKSLSLPRRIGKIGLSLISIKILKKYITGVAWLRRSSIKFFEIINVVALFFWGIVLTTTTGVFLLPLDAKLWVLFAGGIFLIAFCGSIL